MFTDNHSQFVKKKQKKTEVRFHALEQERLESWVQYIQSRFVPKFTQVGFQVIQTPAAGTIHVHNKIYILFNKV